MSFYYFSGETLQKPRNDERKYVVSFACVPDDLFVDNLWFTHFNSYEAHLERVKNVKPVVDTHTEVTRLHRRDMTSQKVAYGTS